MTQGRKKAPRHNDSDAKPEAFDLLLKRGLHKIYDDVANEPVPDELLKLIEEDRQEVKHGRPAWWSRLGHTRGRMIGLAVIASPFRSRRWRRQLGGRITRPYARTAQERAILLDGQQLAGYRAALSAGLEGTVHASLSRTIVRRAMRQRQWPMPYGRYRAPSLPHLRSERARSSAKIGPQVTLPPRPYPWVDQVRGARADCDRQIWVRTAAPPSQSAAPAMARSWSPCCPPAVAGPHRDPVGSNSATGDAVWLLNEDGAMTRLSRRSGRCAAGVEHDGRRSWRPRTDRRAGPVGTRGAALRLRHDGPAQAVGDWSLPPRPAASTSGPSVN